MAITVRKTNDGSATLYNTALNEHYHSVHGALTESRHVFIDNGFLPASHLRPHILRVLEIGFGTGLNAALTAKQSMSVHQKTYYVALEPFPVDTTVLRELAYENVLEAEEFGYYHSIHEAKWNSDEEINPYFQVNKIAEGIQSYRFAAAFHLIYFDAFAPEKQPEMWTMDVLQKCYRLLEKDGMLITYCAKGQFKRDLKQCGFAVKPLPGPPNKREITLAIKS